MTTNESKKPWESVGKIRMEGNTIIIELVKPEDGIPSTSGKMTMLASSGGWKNITGDIQINILVGEFTNKEKYKRGMI